MVSVEVAVLIYHLKLYPDTKIKPHSLYFIGKPGHSAWKFLGIYKPVTKPSVIIISCTEPAVIKNEEFHSDFFSFGGYFYKFFFIKIKIGSFPVIKEDWAGLTFPFTLHQMLSVQVMEGLTHGIVTIIAIHKYSLRSHKTFSGFKFPGETFRMNTKHYPGHIEGGNLDLSKEVAAVHKIKTVNFT